MVRTQVLLVEGWCCGLAACALLPAVWLAAGCTATRFPAVGEGTAVGAGTEDSGPADSVELRPEEAFLPEWQEAAAGIDGEEAEGIPEEDSGGPLTLPISEAGGYDDFSSPGAALGFAVIKEKGLILIAALRFDLPLASKEYPLEGDSAAALTGYVVKPCPVLADAVAEYPWLGAVLTDTAGIRSMEAEATVFLLEGDLDSATPDRIFIADGGLLTLYRLDGPKDVLEGDCSFREVSGLGPGATILPEGEKRVVSSIYFDWPTGKQP